MNEDILFHALSHPHGAGGLFRDLVGYPLFGSAFQTLWPLFLMPLLAALVSERAARLLPRVPGAWIPAAVLAAVPGLLALCELWLVMTPTILGGVDNWKAWMIVWIVPVAGCLLVVRAIMRVLARALATRRLHLVSSIPGHRLARVATRLGIPARELPTSERECFVAGVAHPTVYVSRGALARLTDQELLAALQHERAHVRGRDTLVLAALSFLCDLVPLARESVTEAYRAAREAAADRAAAAGAGSLNLASALLALAGPAPARAQALPMAKSETLRWRLQALLEERPQAPASWLKAAPGLVIAGLFLAWPYAQALLHDVFCWS